MNASHITKKYRRLYVRKFNMMSLEIYSVLSLILVQLVIVKSNPPVPLEYPDPNDAIFTVKYLIKLIRTVHTPYRKFGFTYDKFSLCELRYNQKRAVCNSVYSSEFFNFQMADIKEDYVDLSCQRRRIDLDDVPQVTDTGKLLLSTYECPNPYRIESRYKNKRDRKAKNVNIPVHIFLTGGYFRNSVVLSYKHAGTRPQPAKMFKVLLGVISRKELQRLYLENRNQIYKKEAEPRKFTKSIVARVIGKQDPIQRYQHVADSKIMANNRIKSKPTYLKFRSTYKTVNICSMTKKNKQNLCQQVFESAPYPLRISIVKTDKPFRCFRRKVILLYTFVQVYTAKIALFKCPIEKMLTKNSFFLGSTLENPGMIAFMQIPPFMELLPDAYISRLTSDGLLKKPEPIPRSTAPRKERPVARRLPRKLPKK